jgi:eukaryotic translation initiation factor 2-alpha kinase 4
MAKLERMSPNLANSLTRAVEDVRMTIHYTQFSGCARTIYFRPLMLGNHHDHFTNGIRFEVVRGKKRNDVLASAGRCVFFLHSPVTISLDAFMSRSYDDLINQWSPPKTTPSTICAFALQLDFEKITMALAAYQSRSVGTLIKEQRSFGLWSPRRCDVYVVSYQPGLMQERLEIAALLWQNNISADVMYESGLADSDSESHVDVCAREGILYETLSHQINLQTNEQMLYMQQLYSIPPFPAASSDSNQSQECTERPGV